MSKKQTMPIKREVAAKEGISLLQERLIGRVIVHWAHLEAAMQDTIWHILDIPMDDGRVLTQRMDARIKLQWLRSFSKRHIEAVQLEALKTVLDDIEGLQDDRNFIAHGVWGTDKLSGAPIAVSIRAKSLPDEIVAETFDSNRMRIIIHKIIWSKNQLVKWMDKLDASRGKPPRQHDGG